MKRIANKTVNGKCPVHPSYRAIHPPRAKTGEPCPACVKVWASRAVVVTARKIKRRLLTEKAKQQAAKADAYAMLDPKYTDLSTGVGRAYEQLNIHIMNSLRVSNVMPTA
jgi:hypothetical protein